MDMAAAEEFDVVIGSTGLAESILAAALAKRGLRVLHLDRQRHYGASDSSFTLPELHNWFTECSTWHTNISATSLPESISASLGRKFNLSLRPTLVPAVSPFVDCLIASGASNYSGFRLLESMAVRDKDLGLARIPTSKEQIFNDKNLSLVQKRRVMKFLQFATSHLDQSPLLTSPVSIDSLLRDKFGLDGPLLDSVMYGIAACDHPQEDAKTVLLRLQKYLTSSGRYGTSPFLIGQYGGSSEILQGFCRICAVFGGTYILGSEMPELPQPTQPDQTIEIPDLGPIKTKHVVSMPSWTSRPTTTTARGLLILNNPVSLSAVHTVSLRNTDVEATKPTDQGPEATTEHKQAETALIVFPPVEDRGCVRAVMHGQGTFTAPDGYYVIYLSCEGPADAVAQSLLQPVTDALLSLCETGEDALVYSLYYNDATPEGLLLNGVELSTASPAFKGPTEISDAVLGTALTVFKQITGEDQLFIPEAKRSTDEE